MYRRIFPLRLSGVTSVVKHPVLWSATCEGRNWDANAHAVRNEDLNQRSWTTFFPKHWQSKRYSCWNPVQNLKGLVNKSLLTQLPGDADGNYWKQPRVLLKKTKSPGLQGSHSNESKTTSMTPVGLGWFFGLNDVQGFPVNGYTDKGPFCHPNPYAQLWIRHEHGQLAAWALGTSPFLGPIAASNSLPWIYLFTLPGKMTCIIRRNAMPTEWRCSCRFEYFAPI